MYIDVLYINTLPNEKNSSVVVLDINFGDSVFVPMHNKRMSATEKEIRKTEEA